MTYVKQIDKNKKVGVLLVNFMYPVFTRMPGESYVHVLRISSAN